MQGFDLCFKKIVCTKSHHKSTYLIDIIIYFIYSADPKLWKHVHRFHDLENGKTEIDDNIEAEFKPGLKGMPGRLIWMGLHMLFYFRHWKTRKMLARFYPNDAYAIQYETR